MSATRDIRTATSHVSCDVCGRTLLRGERADTYLAGGSRREVCELCTPRARHAGWVRDGAALERTRVVPGERRRSLLGRLRRRDRADEASGAREPAPAPAPAAPRRPAPAQPRREPAHEPRHVRAVPTSVEQRVAAALGHFNASEHPRTIAGVARSLGVPAVVARPLPEDASVVAIVVAWELCWYRYEVDLSDGGPAVRAAGQGYELGDLEPEDRAEPNAVADDYGTLAPA